MQKSIFSTASGNVVKWMQYFFVLFITMTLSCCEKTNKANTDVIPEETNKIDFHFVNKFPHDTNSFTEGLLIHNGRIFESTGSPQDMENTKSIFGPLDLNSGRIEPKVELDRNKYFGEGIAILGDKLFQLTYKTRIAFVYDTVSYKLIKSFPFQSNEGWGLATDGHTLIMSDGTDALSYLNPETFKVEKKVLVSDQFGPVNALNELEYIKGFIYVNVYMTNNILKIDPNTGKVLGKLDLTDFAKEAKAIYPGALEMNGIAHDPKTNLTYITGKMWPRVYAIRFQ